MLLPHENPLLTPLHPDESLLKLKLERFRKIEVERLVVSLAPGEPGSLKTRADGTIVDGHYRIKVLRERGFNVDILPREVIQRS